MRLKGIEEEVITNSKAESAFTIHATAKAFQILSDGLYEHKIAAIVRELTCNAYDAHVEGGCADQPFRINFPNQFHPVFEIEDFGIGLDEQGVRDVYTGYFNSTKTDSNESIGAFGLGSKTPFAYTSSYTIRARKDGVERLFKAYIGDNGAPQVNMLTQREVAPDDYPSGVKISIPVNGLDHHRFRWEAEFLMSFFKVQPITNDDDFEPLFNISDQLEREGYAIIDSNGRRVHSSLYGGNRFFCLMGGVPYPISMSSFGTHAWSSAAQSMLRMLRDRYAFVQFDIGDLDVTASRESLSLDDDTQAAIQERFRNIYKTMGEEAQSKIDDQFTHTLDAYDYVMERFGNSGPRNFRYKGRIISSLVSRIVRSWDGATGILSGDAVVMKPTYRGVSKVTDPIYLRSLMNQQYDKLFIITQQDPKLKGQHKHLRRLLAPYRTTGGHQYGIAFTGPISDQRKIRINRYFNGRVDIEWLSLEDLREEDKKRRAAERAKRLADQNSNVPKRDPLEIDAISVEFGEPLSSRHRFEVDPSQHVYVMRDPDDRTCVLIKGKSISQRVLTGDIFNVIGYDKTIVIGTQSSEPRLRKHNVPTLDEMFDEGLKKNGKYIRRAVAVCHFTTSGKPKRVHARILDAAGDPDICPRLHRYKKWVNTDLEPRKWNPLVPGSDLFTQGLLPDYLMKAHDELNEIDNKASTIVADRYPILDRMFSIPADYEAHAVEYIKAVTAFRDKHQSADDDVTNQEEGAA